MGEERKACGTVEEEEEAVVEGGRIGESPLPVDGNEMMWGRVEKPSGETTHPRQEPRQSVSSYAPILPNLGPELASSHGASRSTIILSLELESIVIHIFICELIVHLFDI